MKDAFLRNISQFKCNNERCVPPQHQSIYVQQWKMRSSTTSVNLSATMKDAFLHNIRQFKCNNERLVCVRIKPPSFEKKHPRTFLESKCQTLKPMLAIYEIGRSWRLRDPIRAALHSATFRAVIRAALHSATSRAVIRAALRSATSRAVMRAAVR